jgi:protein-S-isoprenylcysteine O-methyltransferase Ste14
MTKSTSTPRLRVTYTLYALLVPAAACIGPAPLPRLLDFALGVAAFLCVALACLGRIWCSTFIAGHKDTRLVTAGPYSRARHPLYSFSMLGALGLALASRSLTLGAIVILIVVVLVVRAAAEEEKFLAAAHPVEFAEYRAITPRKFWPGVGRALPQMHTLAPDVFRKAFLDAGAFLLLFLLVESAARLRLSGVFWHLTALRVI